MSVKRFLTTALIASLIFIGGVLVGRYISAPEVVVVTVDVNALATLIEKSNAQAAEIKKDMAAMKDWNENSLIDPPESQPEEVEKD